MSDKFSNLPMFLCIGAQKAATSWLNFVLQHHPDIWLPPVKELHFFDHLFVEDNRRWTKFHIRSAAKNALFNYINNFESSKDYDFSYAKYLTGYSSLDIFTEKWYRRIYSCGEAKGKVLGDITPEYSTIGIEGIEYVKSLLGDDLKIIYIIRDPVDRALSQFRMNLSRSGEFNMSNLSEVELSNILNNAWPVIENRGHYSKYIPEWLSVFSEQNILFVPYGSLKNNPKKEIKEICEFIGVEPKKINPNVLNEKIHQTKKIKLPLKVKDFFEVKLQCQRDFLLDNFGLAFCKQLKERKSSVLFNWG